MPPTPRDVATGIETAEVNDANPAKIGLKMLQDEAAKRLSTDGDLKTNAFIHSVREGLNEDGFMAGISGQSILSKMQPGDRVSPDLDIYSPNKATSPQHIEPSTQLDLALEHDFANRMGWLSDGSVADAWRIQGTVSYSSLYEAIEESNDSIKAQKVREDLLTSGENGPLWKILQGENPDTGNIDLNTVNRAMSQQASEFSDDQLKALRDLQASWDTNHGAKRLLNLYEKKFQPTHSANGQYLTPQVVNRILDSSIETDRPAWTRAEIE